MAEILQKRGWYIIPSYDYSGEDNEKAPKLQGLKDAHVIPDLDIAKGGVRRWIEVKTKKAAFRFRKLSRDEHGIPERHWHSYFVVQAITGAKVWLAIYEETTGDILVQAIDVLKDKKLRIGEMKKAFINEGRIVNFDRGDFIRLCNIGEKRLCKPGS